MRLKPRSPAFIGDSVIFSEIQLNNPLGVTSGGTNSTTSDGAQTNLNVSDLAHMHESGLVSSVTFTDNGDGTITVSSCAGEFFSTDDYTGYPSNHELTGGTFTIPTNEIRYLVGDYNNGNPILRLTSDQKDINESNIIPVLTILNSNGVLHVRTFTNYINGAVNKHNQRLIYTRGYLRESGLSLSEEFERVIRISEGIAWYGINSYTIQEIDSTSSILYHMYHNGLGEWTYNETNQYDNLHYDDTTTGLKELTDGKYTVNWIYRLISSDSNNNKMVSIQSRNQYDNLSDAQLSTIPEIPTTVQSMFLLIGRIIVLKGSDTATAIENAYELDFGTSIATNHNSLNSLQGGSAGEYYHLNKSEHDTLVGGLDADLLHVHDSKSDKVSGATNNNFASLDELGNLKDSGHKHSDYSLTGHNHDDRYYTETETDSKLLIVPAITIKTDTYTILSSDYLLICNKVSNITINLPSATGSGKIYKIKNINTGKVIVTPDGTETIDNESSQEISQWECLEIIDYSTGLWIIT